MRLIARTATRRNTKLSDKPNEDTMLVDCDNGIFIIVDGVTRDKVNGKYPKPSPALQVSELFVKQAYEYLKSNLTRNDYKQIIKDAFEYGNCEICNFNKNYSGGFLPGTVGIIALIKDGTLFFGYIGDCIGEVISKNKKKKFTSCQTQKIHQHVKEFTATEIRNIICNNVSHPYAYGVLDGRKGALDFVEVGEIDLQGYDVLLLFTDGAENYITTLTYKALLEMQPDSILGMKIQNESTDDKSLIKVRIINNENGI